MATRLVIPKSNPAPALSLKQMYLGGYGGAGWKYPGSPAGGYSTVAASNATAPAAGAGAGAGSSGGFNFNSNQGQINALVQRILGQTYTPAQQAAYAKQMTDAQINAAILGQQTAARQAQLYTQNQADRAQGFALALNSLGQGDSAQIAALYNHAGGLMQGLGTSLTGAIGDAEKGAVQGAQTATSQATGGLGSVQTPYDPAAMQNVAQYTGVVAPVSNIYAQGANQGAQALWQNQVGAQHVSNIAADYLAQGNLTQQNLAMQEAQTQAQRPLDYLNAVNTMRQTGLSGLSAALQGLGLAGMYGNYASQAGLRTAQGTLAGARAGQANATTTQKTASTTGILPNGRLAPGYHWVAGAPQKILAHYMPDPNDPTQTRVVADPNNPPTGMIYNKATGDFVAKPTKSGTTSATAMSSIISRGTKAVQTALQSPAFAVPDPVASERSQVSGGPVVYKPSGRYTMEQARQLLIQANFDKKYWKNPQVVNSVNQALIGMGYHPTPVTKKAAGWTSIPKTKVITNKDGSKTVVRTG